MKKQVLFSLIASLWCGGSFAAIVGAGGTCVGNSQSLYSTVDSATGSGSIWTSSNPLVAAISGSSTSVAYVTGVSAGTAVITFSGPSGISTHVFTVAPPVAPITGSGSMICAGSGLALACATPGGTWSSSSPWGCASVSTGGIVTGIDSGVATIHYTIASGCYSSTTVTVNGGLADGAVASGIYTLCVGATDTTVLHSYVPTGGTWSSSNPSVATVNSTGEVTGVAAGSAIISYQYPGGPCITIARDSVWVLSTTPVPTVTGTSTVAVGHNIALSAWGSTWSSSNTSVATVNYAGVVTGVAPGTATITSSITGCSGLATGSAVVTVTSDCIAGDILFSGPPVSSSFKVWLIKYNPSTLMLSAVDSQVAYVGGSTTGHYVFCGMGTDTYRVKAAHDTAFTGSGLTGYQPTYHNASAYWSSANVINHTAGVMDIGKDINMGYGTVTSGPGFIAGDVTTGANKGTADGDPVPNMLVFCVNNTTGAIMQQAYTNAAGHYTFNNLPTGVPFKIYPELINYATTPYPPITLSSASSSMSVAHFVQHTLSHTITPIVVSVSTLEEAGASVSIFPNPAKGTFNVEWNMQQPAGNASVNITDVTGRRVLATTIDMSVASGVSPINVAGLAHGLYIVQVKTNGLTINSKIEIQ